MLFSSKKRQRVIDLLERLLMLFRQKRSYSLITLSVFPPPRFGSSGIKSPSIRGE